MTNTENETSRDEDHLRPRDLAHFTMGEGANKTRLTLRGQRRPSDYLGEQFGDLAVHVMVESDKDGQIGELVPLDEVLSNPQEYETV
jgi:hypothetical protein